MSARVPSYFIWVCPYCGKQYRGPGGHHLAGDDRATSCFHRHPGERGVTQPLLTRVEVVLAAPFALRPIPHDQQTTPWTDAMERYEGEGGRS